jgi:ABC-type multidrug transport system fused ATPase/permease subunit
MKYLIRIRVFLKPYTWQIFANLVILLTMTGLSLVVPRIIQGIIDEGLLIWRSGLPRISATICATGCTTTSNICHSPSMTMPKPVN